jgi:hypothetical protein
MCCVLILERVVSKIRELCNKDINLYHCISIVRMYLFYIFRLWKRIQALIISSLIDNKEIYKGSGSVFHHFWQAETQSYDC